MKNDIQPRAIALDSSGYIQSQNPRYVPQMGNPVEAQKSQSILWCITNSKMYLQHWIAQNKAMTSELY